MRSLTFDSAETVQLSITRRESWAIDCIRIICIFFMICVHVYPGTREQTFVYTGPAHVLWILVVDILGRASVAALSFCAGYVLFIQTGDRTPSAIIAGRFRTIFVPMVTWNVLAFVSVWIGLLALGNGDRTIFEFFRVDSVWDLLSLFLAIDRHPANMPIGFLRDLFVAIVLLTVLRGVIARWGVLVLVAFLPVTVLGLTEPVILRPSIALFALAGFVCASVGWTLTQMATPRVALSAFLAFSALYLVSLGASWEHPALAVEVPNLAKRAALVALMLFLGVGLSASWFGLPVHRFRTVLFVTFLSHGIVSELLGEIYVVSGGSVTSVEYLVFFLVSPLAMLAVGAAIDQTIRVFPAGVQVALRGTASRDR